MTLRDDVIAYHQTHACDARFSHKRLLLRVPLATAEQLNLEHKHLDLFDATLYDADDTEDYIYLTLYPDYDVENDVLGEKGFRNTFNSPAVYAPANTRRGFKVTVKDHRKLILNIIKQLADISETTSYRRYSPVKVVDFCHPETTSASAYDGELATIRWGELVLDTNLPSLIKAKEDYLKKDWGFTFKETILRPGTMTFTTSPDITETQVVGGIDPSGDVKPIAVTEDGKVIVEGAGGSTTGGATEITLAQVRNRLPPALTINGALKTDSSASTQPISGSVSVSNFPSTQLVSGNISVGNFPETQAISGSVSVSNFPATQPVSGSVAVSSLPALSAGSNAIGSVSVSNFALQPVSLLSNVTTSVNGSSQNLGSIFKDFQIQLIVNSGSLTTISIDIQISANGSKWHTVTTFTDTADGGILILTNTPTGYLKANVTVITGTSPNISLVAVGM
ncbi:hypothetical protein WA1_18850 [Scytonema hofmannii PCC 7110]|uniref:Uncharacterized protein n=1 Tax=Scytonema hofmannii PCC 7110 TaxID=128403 RepID=A0A139XBR8_9CYAN|nr:hypothetical protein [Scytonema hofmannii]KYC42062.1 hypothetical protein WA1_18850 [Scytonema hofmannii PCC 7110]